MRSWQPRRCDVCSPRPVSYAANAGTDCPKTEERERWRIASAGLLGACLVYAMWAASIGWHNTVLDLLGFRQAQTALTAYFMVGRLPQLAYETPVVGPPWSIPFELPLYQWVVAAVVTLFDTPLDETGRAVNLTFFFLTLLPAYRLLAWLGVARGHRLLALSVFAVSPFYLFWSRTFLIESTALFFSVCYLAAALPAAENPRFGRISVALLLGVLAALVKITTCFVFSLLTVLYLLHRWHVEGRGRFRLVVLGRYGLLVLVLIGGPFAAGWSWTCFADQQKALNPIGRHLMTSSEVMQLWNYGTWSQRCTVNTWRNILFSPYCALGHGLVLAFAAAAMVLGRHRWRPFLACLLVYPVAPLVFTNLYLYHEYYAFANNVLLLAAVALALIALLERGGVSRGLGLLGLAGFLALAVWRHQEHYAPIQAANHDELHAVSRTIQQVTRPEEVVVVLGCDWSSELPYYSRRRSLCIPFWLDLQLDSVPGYLAMQPPNRVGALVIDTGFTRFDRAAVEETVRQAGFEVEYHRADNAFEVYAVKPASPAPTASLPSGDGIARP